MAKKKKEKKRRKTHEKERTGGTDHQLLPHQAD